MKNEKGKRVGRLDTQYHLGSILYLVPRPTTFLKKLHDAEVENFEKTKEALAPEDVYEYKKLICRLRLYS